TRPSSRGPYRFWSTVLRGCGFPVRRESRLPHGCWAWRRATGWSPSCTTSLTRTNSPGFPSERGSRVSRSRVSGPRVSGTAPGARRAPGTSTRRARSRRRRAARLARGESLFGDSERVVEPGALVLQRHRIGELDEPRVAETGVELG